MILEIFNFLHFLGTAFGLGGATIASIISMKAEKDLEIARVSGKIISSVVKLIWVGMALLIISGIGLTIFAKWPLNNQMLIVKHVLVFWMIVFGVAMGLKMKKLKKLAAEKKQVEILRAKKQMKVLGIINLILWYLVAFLSILI